MIKEGEGFETIKEEKTNEVMLDFLKVAAVGKNVSASSQNILDGEIVG